MSSPVEVEKLPELVLGVSCALSSGTPSLKHGLCQIFAFSGGV